jgi:hypothetical protein
MKLNIVISGADERTIDAIVDQQFTIQEVMVTELTALTDTDTIRQATKILAEGASCLYCIIEMWTVMPEYVTTPK